MTVMQRHRPVRPYLADQVAAMRQGKLKSRQLLEDCLGRIEGEPQVNAVVEVDAPAARAAADQADKGFMAGAPVGPLAGLPFTVKRLFQAARFEEPSTGGSAVSRDAAVVALLEASGAVLFGRTNAPVGGEDIDTVHPDYGRTSNPLFPGLTVGGSSGGSAAAVAAGHSPFDIGSDVSGSVRLPAHCCEVLGFRPSTGALSVTGHDGVGVASVRSPEFLMPGLLARSSEDLRLLWAAIGPATAVPRSGSRRLAVCLTDPAARPEAAVEERLARAVFRLRGAGVEVDMVPLPVDLDAAWLLYQLLLFVDPHSVGERCSVGDPEPLPGSEPLEVALWARDNTVGRLPELRQRRAEGGKAWNRFFGDYRAVLTPATLTPALPSRDASLPVLADTFVSSGLERPMFDVSIWSALASLFGLPAVVTPVERTEDGEPVAMQLVGPRAADADLLALLVELESLLAGTTDA